MNIFYFCGILQLVINKHRKKEACVYFVIKIKKIRWYLEKRNPLKDLYKYFLFFYKVVLIFK